MVVLRQRHSASVEYLRRGGWLPSHHRQTKGAGGQGGAWHAEEKAEEKGREKGRGGACCVGRGAVEGCSVQAMEQGGRAKKKKCVAGGKTWTTTRRKGGAAEGQGVIVVVVVVVVVVWMVLWCRQRQETTKK